MLSLPRQVRTNFGNLVEICLVPEDTVTPLPGFLACRPWQALQGIVLEQGCLDCCESSYRHQETRTNSCSLAYFRYHFRVQTRVRLPKKRHGQRACPRPTF